MQKAIPAMKQWLIHRFVDKNERKKSRFDLLVSLVSLWQVTPIAFNFSILIDWHCPLPSFWLVDLLTSPIAFILSILIDIISTTSLPLFSVFIICHSVRWVPNIYELLWTHKVLVAKLKISWDTKSELKRNRTHLALFDWQNTHARPHTRSLGIT